MAITKINDCFELLAMVTYADKLKSIIKKEFSISFEEFAVLTYISEHESEEYYLKDIINHLNYKQPQVVKAVKNLSRGIGLYDASHTSTSPIVSNCLMNFSGIFLLTTIFCIQSLLYFEFFDYLI